MINIIIVACVFCCASCLFVFAAARITLVFELASEGELDNADVLEFPFGSVIVAMSGLFAGPYWKDTVASVKDRLVQAGNPGGKMSGEVFLAILALISISVWLVNFLIFFFIGGLTPIAVLFPVFFGVVTFVVGNMWLNSLIVDRKKDLIRSFPYFIDMSVMVIGAGSTFPQAIKIYLKENPDGALTSELKTVSGEIDYGKSIIEALNNMEERMDATGIKNTLRSLSQGLKMGTPINESLAEQADAMRFMRSQLAERVAEQMKIRMQGPAMLLLISVLVLILGPAIVNLNGNEMF